MKRVCIQTVPETKIEGKVFLEALEVGNSGKVFVGIGN